MWRESHPVASSTKCHAHATASRSAADLAPAIAANAYLSFCMLARASGVLEFAGVRTAALSTAQSILWPRSDGQWEPEPGHGKNRRQSSVGRADVLTCADLPSCGRLPRGGLARSACPAGRRVIGERRRREHRRPFELVDQHGVGRTDADFRGAYMLMYFGFTYCPDTCPTTLLKITNALEELAAVAPNKAERVVPVFISVDPERDTPEALRGYAELPSCAWSR